MSRAFSKLMGAAEGRFLTELEQEQALAASLELPHRMLVSRMLHHLNTRSSTTLPKPTAI